MSVFNSPFNQVFRNPFGSPFNGGASGGVAWTPALWFLANEQGLWLDPSDFTTMFQDAAGTTPVTAVEQPVGLILDKRLPATSTAPLDALAFVPAGSTPPTAADTTFLSEPCGSITFPANAGGYTVSRGASATTHPIVAGRRYTHSYRIALSRALTGGETLVVRTTGQYGSDNFITLNSGTAGGAWIDFADATVIASANASGSNSCYAYAGTAIASPVTIYIRRYTVHEVPGNHASQTTAASRPVLSARKNLLTKTEDFSDATWVKYACTVTANQDGIADKLVPAAASGTYKSAQSSVNMFSGAGGRFTMQCKVKDAGCGFAWLLVAGNNGRATYNLTTGAATVYGGTNASASASPVDVNGYRLLTLTADIVAEGVAWVGGIESAADPAVAYTSSGTNGILIKDVQVEYGSTATRYQRVNTNTDYDTVGFPHYLKFDGVDDYLRTVFPNLGSNVTIGRSIPGTGASILAGQTIGAGNWDDSTSHCALVIIDRALTGPETALLTEYLNTRAGL